MTPSDVAWFAVLIGATLLAASLSDEPTERTVSPVSALMIISLGITMIVTDVLGVSEHAHNLVLSHLSSN